MMRGNRRIVGAAVMLACSVSTGSAWGAVAQTHFNGLNLGRLKFQNAVGPGLTGQWSSGSSVPDVVTGDLTAPAATNFNLAEATGNGPQRVAFDNVLRQNGADLSTALDGTVWGTFLVNTADGGSAGVGVNSVVTFSTFAGRPHLLATGSDLFFDGSDGANTATATGVIPAGVDTLILTRLTFDGASGFTIDAWVNPDLTSPLPAATLSSLSSNTNALAINRIAVGGAKGTTANGSIDLFTLSNDPDAYFDVTGQPFPGFIPEPASLGLLALAGLAFGRRRRSRSA